jgi:ribonuclease HII
VNKLYKLKIKINILLKSSYSNNLIEVGCDEAGRGCLAGPVFAAAVILPPDFEHPLLNDSKKLSEKNRYFLRQVIFENAVEWAVASIDNKEIDKINILNASIKAMQTAISQLKTIPELILVDGNRFKPYKEIEYKTIVKGDGIFASIAAASILAKTFRDDYMKSLHEQYSVYDWKQNKGYPTKFHRQMVMENGLSPFHRSTFCKFYFQTQIDFKKTS